MAKFDFGALDEQKRREALREIAELRVTLGRKSLLIDSAFGKLESALRRRGTVTRTNPRAALRLARLLRTLAPLATASTALTPFIAAPAMAAIPVYEEGDLVVNPETGDNETVAYFNGYAVVTLEGNYILVAQTVGDEFTVTDYSGESPVSTTYEVTEVVLTDGRVTSVTVKNLTSNAEVAIATTTPYTGEIPVPGETGGGFSNEQLNPGEPYRNIVGGGAGGNGSAGGGVCFGALGCIEWRPGNGGAGGTPDDLSVEIPESHGLIDTDTPDNAGIVVVSKGGDGGNGGTGYGNIDPARGGDGGDGGTVTATNKTVVTTGGDNSYGMLVQSVGGRSGSGGNCYIACSGGGPGIPGDGGSATGINDGSITTGGIGAVGLYVQSSGGNSGTGGDSYGVVGDGGSGGYGGNGGDAHAVNNGTIHTTGERAYGVLAQSIGGIGGNAGDAGGIVAWSGNGGGGGIGGNASIELGPNSLTTTTGDWAHAVFAQSIGGGGGSSGWSGGAASFGAEAGNGGRGGNVTIEAAAGAIIGTTGQGAYGIFAESIGGSGGTAGGTGGVFTMGGTGGAGMIGGNVIIDSSATIITTGDDARGIFAQSVGGGGGNANTSGGVVSLGGEGGSGANGGTVEITLGEASFIKTTGLGADGVFAQSVGGGGGAGAASGGLAALGGKGDVGGDGQDVEVQNAGRILTEKKLARGIFAQSVGGGGGAGGSTGGLAAIGGEGDAGGAGGKVTVGNSGLISTGGDFSQGIFAQSIGGGGGSGGDGGALLAAIGGEGSAGGLGGEVFVSNSGLVTTTGNMSSAVQAQSIGGGGGEGGTTGGVFLTIGGGAGSGTHAGDVTATITGGLLPQDGDAPPLRAGMHTTGDDSHGLFVQSIGGGGGNGGSASSVSAFVGVTLGGNGSAGGDGGTATVNFESTTAIVEGVEQEIAPLIVTEGDRSRGVYVQSVGGGGGNGGYAANLTLGAWGSVSVALGGAGSSGGDGGNVEVTGDVEVLTLGDYSEGILLQSVGGGGGAGGFAVASAASAGLLVSGSVSVGLGGAGGFGGDGHLVEMNSGGSIVTGGDFSTGLLAQSVGGGGGAGGFSVAAGVAASDTAALAITVGIGGAGGSGGDGGDVNVTFDGDIVTGWDIDGVDHGGDDSVGAIIQSIGGGGGAGGFNVSGAVAGAGVFGGGVAVGLGGSAGGGGDGGIVIGHIGGDIRTSGDRSSGAIIQSIGGGGGSGGFNVSGTLTGSGVASGGVSVGLGGAGAGAGDGNSVTGSVGGTILTTGDQSDGLLVQSVGGGGGSGGFNVSGNVSASGVGSGAIAVGLGGSGGGGGDGGQVTAHAYDAIGTQGDQSRGFIAQSVGGGGGGGGFNVNGGLAVSGTGSGTIGVGLGGSGGDGGSAGSVTATARTITTAGDDAAGFIAQSIGGGGGTGGFNVTGGMAFSGVGSGSVGVGLGGTGGGGGHASTVEATVIGNVITQGDRSGAVLAQSVGGGGGSGGFNVSADMAFSGVGSGAVSVGIGGSGGEAGNADDVTLNLTGMVQTGDPDEESGDYSDGIVAQSIGGGGGSGGFNVTGNIGGAGVGAGQVGVGIGGRGAGGGTAGDVVLNVNDGVTENDVDRIAALTWQDNSAGIIAQSIGGGGGNGGFNVTGGISFGGTGAGGVNVGIGGSGGGGNTAGDVTADITGLVQTAGDDSAGIIAQSVGGGGGNGGFNVAGGLALGGEGSGSVNVGIGGSGAAGGDAGDVTLRINDEIVSPSVDLVAVRTSGDRSAGVVAQSLGGGGGNGGFNVAAGLNISGGYTGGANVGVGGSGGSGGDAGDVTADITGAILTGGDESGGLLVQSVGGGGGNGGFNVTGGLSVSGSGAGLIGVGIGGSGGDGGDAGDVTLDFNQRTDDEENTLIAVLTGGDDSDAIVVQSLGGGGGNGGFNVTGNASISGGPSGNVGVGVGGFGGSGGDAGTVTSAIAGDVITGGDNSNAVLIQSAGGGGGNGGFNVTGNLAIGAATGAGNIGVGIGGFGGSGGAGGDVDSTLVGDVLTTGVSSTGVTVQSLGGGGGNGGFNVTGNLAVTPAGPAGNLGVGLGGFGADGGDAGSVTSSITGNIQTEDEDSYGLLVQSLGGGGGNGGFNVTSGIGITAQGTAGNLGVGLGGFGGGGGDAGDVDSTLIGNLVTLSDRSSGATVQSLGGGGGNGGFNVTAGVAITAQGSAGNLGVGLGGFGGDGGDAGSATSSITGNVVTTGDDSYGLFVQSAGGGGGNGGFNVTGSVAVTAQGSAGNLGVGLGGFGGGGGAADAASSTLVGNLHTVGDRSSGVTVQSLGGGGGNGAFNVTAGVTASAQGSAGTVGVGIGGFGGDGGAAGTAYNSILGNVTTEGANSYAVLVQSAGGGGGNGGFNVTGAVTISSQGSVGNLGVGIGGFGGGGGDADSATSIITGDVITLQHESSGVTVQSLGGGGGNGGFNVTGGVSVEAGSGASGNLGVGIGGFGGDGGAGGSASSTITGGIFTRGEDSYGLLVQSAGGGGGNGGFNVTGNVAVSSQGSAGNLGVGIGGFGGAGGNAGDVTSVMTGNILTGLADEQGELLASDRSSGATIQSIGGGGGNGGFNVTGNVSLTGGTTTAGNIGIGLGGFGGAGGDGGTVDATQVGNIVTRGEESYGILVQSAGGGGGSGGMNITGAVSVTKGTSGNVGVGLGGFGGSGGEGGAVTANLTGNVLTDGDRAYGATIQSLGGAGGAGGMNITGNLSISAGSGTSIAASVGLGGFGGGGGDAGTVNGSAIGYYQTTGDDSDGVLVQSAGGGGGAGGINVAGAIALSSGTTGSGAVGLGGFGGGGGDGNTVDFTRIGDTVTSGANSNGVTIQSIGGGGGRGGINVSGAVSATKGNDGAVAFGLGGFGGDGGNGGDVTGAVYGNVYATGLESDIVVPVYDLSDLPDDIEITDPEELAELELLIIGEQRIRSGGSTGVLIQSVGGGGGAGGLNVSGAIAVTAASGTSTGRAASIGIGGFGGAGGNAGNVTGTVAAPDGSEERIQVQSVGDSQMAVAVQSIGGGGGAGGMNISGGVSTSGLLVVGIGGFGGAGGTGGDVIANVDADLFAAGNNAIGFLAQSVGGGGGAGGINISGGIQAATKGNEPEVVFGLGGFGGAGNTAGNVTATQNGQVMVEGMFSYGVLAQSVGGGGGAGGLNISAALTGAGNAAKKTEGIAISAGVGGNGGTGANAGDVDLTSNGNIFVNTVITEVDGELELSAVEGAGFAPGVVAQSIGGGGGAGGMNITGSLAPKGIPIAVGVGGTGGVGGDAGDVTVTRGYGEEGPAAIVTFGQGSHGLVAQSIGGGGGNAGFNLVIAANKSKPKQPQLGATVTVGGDGGASGDGGDVEVQHKGDIYTHGGGSNGILAQSISNGGGSGATNITGSLMKDSSVLSLAIGGRGGDGGNAGDVTVTHDGTIVTLGAASAAIRAQSIGSGGGDASSEEDLTGFIPEDLPVDLPIPIGAKNEISVGIGDVGGRGGIAGDVSVTAAGLLMTQGEDAVGIHAQSIGGSGGTSSAISVGLSGENQKGSQGGGVSVSVGLEGGEGGIAGNVTVDSSAQVYTEGERARGIFAQSIGGSGGAGGEASNSLENASNEMHISVGGPGGSGAQAGNVTVTHSGRIDTLGDDADGILAQSIGGGGGAGGASGTQTLMYESSDSNTLAIAVGGSGGNGAIAGDVSVTNDGIIMTSGAQSFGIRAQSIGGGGGVGGAIDSKKLLITGTSNSLEFNVGGSGGEGSRAGDVEVINTGLIWTTGVDAAAISANSIGGGGGDAGGILDLAVSAATSNSFKANIGGMGGNGGIAGDVTVINRVEGDENSGYLITEGDGAYGIFAQSLGGSGGNSSTILSITVEGGSGSVSAGFNFGNAGGTGNLAGNVLVDNGGFIDTSGEGAHGILAQSIGGGGGNGGIVLTGNINLSMPVGAPLISIGGSGGDGGDAGDVDVINSGSIVTRGAGAHGIVAQSIGGGGGNAGVGIALTGEPGSLIVSNTLAASLGATTMTGTGGQGGNVTVTHTGDITVLGEGSQAIVAQSINGGGGTLKLDFNGIAALFVEDEDAPTSAEAPDPLVVARAGGSGSTGMNGGKVVVNSTGTIGVGGEGGVAVSLSSIGGGGGTIELRGTLVDPNGGNSTMALARTTMAEPDIVPVGLELVLGAEDGADNAGGDIEGSQEGAIVTVDANSLGLVIQSIGGGGGRGFADFEAEDIAMLAGATITLGGTNQVDSPGGAIAHDQDGTITTLGDFSIGGLIQSIGGGGGVATVSFSQTGGLEEDTELASLALAPLDIGTTSTVTLGASGGTGNDGGNVSQTISGGAIAGGDYSAALLLQSIGAGGGAVTLAGDAYPLVKLGGTDGAEGSGGDVSLTNNGAIGSLGVGSYAVVLQSIGGGGGVVFGDFADALVELSDDNAGDGGAITFTQVGDIGALGDSSVGILAQSLGGGGGFVFGHFAGTAGGEGAGGAITLNVDGSIVANGVDSTAVIAQSLGSTGGGNITLLSSGDIRGGSGMGMAISFDGGADNLIDTEGTVSAVSGLAITTTTGNDTVENRGAIVGNAFLGEGTNLIHNNLGATYFTISTLDLQDGSGSGAFVNDGSVELGLRAPRFPVDLAAGDAYPLPTFDDIKTATLYGVPVISEVALDGDYTQSSTGEIWYDVAFGPYPSDRIDATGDVTVDGTAHVTLTWLENANPVTLLSAGGTATDNGMEVADTIALDFSVIETAQAIQLGIESDFAQPFLNRNQQQLGKHLDSALGIGGASGLGRLLALLGNLTEGQEDVYQAVFDELDPESLLAPAIENLDSARDFSKAVMGCDPLDHETLDACVWGAVEIHKLKRDGDKAAPIDFDEGVRLRIGGAAGIGNGWSVGAAFGYDALGKVRFGNQRAEGDDGDAVHVGVGVGKEFGADGRGSAGLNLAAGWQKQRMTRVQDIFGPSLGIARVKSDYLAANVNLGYSFGSGPWFVRPNVDASAIRLSIASFEERGLDGLGMAVDKSDEWYLSIEPKLTVGAKFDTVHLALTGGGMFANKDVIGAPMRFLGAPPSSDPAIITTSIDDQAFVGGFELGVDASSRLDVSVGYKGYFGSQIESHTANVNLRLRF